MSTVSVLILTRNEEKHIRDCIESCLPIADEVIVIDDGSTDQTVAISEELGAKVVQHALNRDWAQQRMFAISQASCEWILFVDADERVSSELQVSIRDAIAKEDRYAYWMERHNIFHHNTATHGSMRPDKVLRLMPKDGAEVSGVVHETISSSYPGKKLEGKLFHYTYDNWEQYLSKMNRYTTIAAEQYYEAGKRCSFFKDILLRPSWAFFKIYILQGGCLDGRIGFVLSLYHYIYTVTKYVKLYYLQRSKGQL